MGWFSNLTSSIGSGISNTLSGVIGGVAAPIFQGVNAITGTVMNSSGANSIGAGLGGNAGGLGSLFGSGGGLGSILGSLGIGGGSSGSGTPPAAPPSSGNEDKGSSSMIWMIAIGAFLLFGGFLGGRKFR